MSDERELDEKLGLSLKDTRKYLGELLAERKAVRKILYPKGVIDEVKDLSGKEILNNKLADLDKKISQVLEYYNLHLLESLDTESKKLNKLTGVLLAFTVLLSVLTLALLIRKCG